MAKWAKTVDGDVVNLAHIGRVAVVSVQPAKHYVRGWRGSNAWDFSAHKTREEAEAAMLRLVGLDDAASAPNDRPWQVGDRIVMRGVIKHFHKDGSAEIHLDGAGEGWKYWTYVLCEELAACRRG